MRTIGSQYLKQIGFPEEKQMFNKDISTPRLAQMAIIKDLRSDYELSHKKLRFYNESTSQISSEDYDRMSVSMNYMSKIINEFITLIKKPTQFNTDSSRKLKVLNKAIGRDYLNWNDLFREMLDKMESSDGFYYTWADNEESKRDGIPTLKVIDNNTIKDIQINQITKEPEVYIQQERMWREITNMHTGKVERRNERDVYTYYARGFITVKDSYMYSLTEEPNIGLSYIHVQENIKERGRQCANCNKIIYNEDAECCTCGCDEFNNGIRVFPNKPEYKDIIRLVYIPSYKKDNKKFGKIPAVDYIDDVLTLASLHTTLYQVVSRMSYPIMYCVDGAMNCGVSSYLPTGMLYFETDQELKEQGKSATVGSIEISNKLAPLIEAIQMYESDLNRKSFLIDKIMEQQMAGSDSSRNSNQLRLGAEMKAGHYLENIIDGLAPFFRVVLRENNAITKKEFDDKKKFTFKMPDVLINNSVFEQLLLIQQKRALGLSTLKKELREKGMSPEEVATRIEEIQEEVYLKNSDMDYSGSGEVEDNVSNSQNVSDEVKGLDNNLK